MKELIGDGLTLATSHEQVAYPGQVSLSELIEDCWTSIDTAKRRLRLRLIARFGQITPH